MADFTIEKAVAMVRAMLPIRTGNLVWNATYPIDMGGGEFDIIIDDRVAPYINALNDEWTAKPKPISMQIYTGLFSERIPEALSIFIGSDLQTQNVVGMTSIGEIANTARNTPERQKLLERYIGVKDERKQSLIGGR